MVIIGKWPVFALGGKPSQQQQERLNVGGVRERETGGGQPDEAHAQTVSLKCKPAKLVKLYNFLQEIHKVSHLILKCNEHQYKVRMHLDRPVGY